MARLGLPQWLLISFHLLLLQVRLICPYHLSLTYPFLLIHLSSSSAFIPCLQWRYPVGPSTLPSFTSIFLILAPVALQTSWSNVWREIHPFRVRSQSRISGRERKRLNVCLGVQLALGLNTGSFTYHHLWDIGSVTFFHLWNENKRTHSWTRLLLKLVLTLTHYHIKATSAQNFSVIPAMYQVECRNQNYPLDTSSSLSFISHLSQLSSFLVLALTFLPLYLLCPLFGIPSSIL